MIINIIITIIIVAMILYLQFFVQIMLKFTNCHPWLTFRVKN